MKTWLISATIFYCLALLPSAGFIVISPMLFDAPGSENSSALWVVFNSMLMLPVSIIIALAGMWIWHKRGAAKISLAFSLLPVANVVLIIVSYTIAIFTI